MPETHTWFRAGHGVGGVFSAGKKMSERSELFFPEEKTPPSAGPAKLQSRNSGCLTPRHKKNASPKAGVSDKLQEVA